MGAKIDEFNELNNSEKGVKIDYEYAGPNESILILKLNGYLDTKNSQDFMNCILSIINANKGFSKLVLDLKEVTYISSTGIGSLTNILVHSKKFNIAFFLMNVNEKIINVIKMLGFVSFFKIINSIKELSN